MSAHGRTTEGSIRLDGAYTRWTVRVDKVKCIGRGCAVRVLIRRECDKLLQVLLFKLIDE